MPKRFWTEDGRTRLVTDIIDKTFRSRILPIYVKYILTIIITTLLMLIRIVFPSIFNTLPLIIFLPGLIICSLLFGYGSGVVAAAVSLVYASLYSYAVGLLLEQYVAFVFGAPIFLLTALIVDSLIAVTHSLGEQKAIVERADADKALRIRETVHRTRNDLTTLASLIRLQSSRLTDEASEARQAMDTIAYRLAVLVRVHQRLYVSDLSPDMPAVKTYEFLTDLLEDLQTGRIIPIGIEADIEDHEMDHTTAVSIGLILNEAITNAIKYAFIGVANGGKIWVTLRKIEDRFNVKVQDNGVNDGAMRGTGLGTRLMNAMAAQIDGSLTVSVDSGTTVLLTFPAATPALRRAY